MTAAPTPNTKHLTRMVKKIHICWFGGNMPDSVKRNLDCWRRLNPDYEIRLHDESSVDVSAYPYAQRATAAKRWGFVTDIVRLIVLLREGGWYFDADVEPIRPLDTLDKGDDKLILGYMYDCAIGTAAMYAPPQHPYLQQLLEKYHHIHPEHWIVNNSVFTEFFVNEVPGFLLNGRAWENELCRLYPKEMFEQPSFIRSHGLSIHHCCGSWKTAAGSFSVDGRTSLFAHLDKWARRKWTTWRARGRNEFTACYRAALKGERLPFDTSYYYEKPQQ